jgi:hypothetical protein
METHCRALVLAVALALAACKAPSAASAPAATPTSGRAPDPARTPFDGSSESALTDSAARLFRETPSVSARVLEPLTLQLDVKSTGTHDLRISLDRIWRICQADPAGCEGATRDFVIKVIHTVATPEPPAERDQIVAVLRPRAYFDSVGGPAAARAMLDPFVDDLYVVYVIDMPESTRSVGQKDLDALKLTQADLPALARANLGKRLGHVREMSSAKAGDIAVLQAGGFFESSRLLLTEDWAALASKLGQPIVVAVPSGDVVIVLVGPTPDALEKLRGVVTRAYGDAQRPVSQRLFRWDAGTWTVVP